MAPTLPSPASGGGKNEVRRGARSVDRTTPRLFLCSAARWWRCSASAMPAAASSKPANTDRTIICLRTAVWACGRITRDSTLTPATCQKASRWRKRHRWAPELRARKDSN